MFTAYLSASGVIRDVILYKQHGKFCYY